MSIDLSEPFRDALVGAAVITGSLPAYLDSYPVFTRTPVPDDAPYPMIVVHPQLPGADADGISDRRPVLVRDVAVYGLNDTAAHYREVETLANSVWSLFDRQRDSIAAPAGWVVVDVQAREPRPGPVDNDDEVARRVEVSVRLAAST